jgi:hypothetical protein
MSSADKQGLDDGVLSRYLLGSLPSEESERVDELSIADDEFVLRLDAVENDLVDAYARGDLSGDALQQFQNFYLSSPRRREKVEFARALLRFSEKSPSAVAGATMQAAIAGGKPTDRALQNPSLRSWFAISRLDLKWGFAATAAAFLFTSAYLFVANDSLRKQATEARNQQSAWNQRAQDLELQLKEQRTANGGLQRELEELRSSLPRSQALGTIAVLLAPQTRGVSQLRTIPISPLTNRFQVTLRLEAEEFSRYKVALKDPATNRVLWRSEELPAKLEDNSRTVSVTFSAKLLKTQNYILELSGVSDSGVVELISSYPFKAIVQ